MPKELTHWILAEQTMEGLAANSRIRELISSHHAVYLAGAVLPDTLLYLYRGPHSTQALDLANRFHDTGGNSFAPLIHAEQRYQGELPAPLLACLLGVISHMKADIVFHPFVYALTGSDDIGLHYRLETDMDLYFLNRGFLTPLRQLKPIMTPGNREIVINACALLFDPDGTLPRQALEHALSLHCRIQAMYDNPFWKLAAMLLSTLFGPPYSQQRQLFYPLFRTHKQSGILSNRGTWQHPSTAVEQRETLDDLAGTTVQLTLKLFELIESKGSLADALNIEPGENLLTGIHGACLSSVMSARTP